MEVKNVHLKDYSSFKIGGQGNLVLVSNEKKLLEVISYSREKNMRNYILGEGTNTIFTDNLSGILFIKIEMMGIDVVDSFDDVLVTANAGETWDDVVKYTVDKELWGIENLSLIPGTVGAAPVQNIGAYGTELKDVLVSVRVLDTLQNIFINMQNSDCNFGYRDSIFKQQSGRYVITSVCLKLSKKPKPVLIYKPLDTLSSIENLRICDVRELVISTRQAKLPDYHLHPNTGSFFKNSVISRDVYEKLKAKFLDMPGHEQADGYKIPTAWLIENVANMKGLREGDVGTWPSQPLVLVNYGSASYENLNTFSEKIIKKIYDETGIKIEREVNII